jgi:hypothetical protein
LAISLLQAVTKRGPASHKSGWRTTSALFHLLSSLLPLTTSLPLPNEHAGGLKRLGTTRALIAAPLDLFSTCWNAGGLKCLGATRARNHSTLSRVTHQILLCLSVQIRSESIQNTKQGKTSAIKAKTSREAHTILSRKTAPISLSLPINQPACLGWGRWHTSPRCGLPGPCPSASHSRQLSLMRRRISTSQGAIRGIRG